MSVPVSPPPRRNPVARTGMPALLSAQRSRATHGLTAAAAQGLFCLQVCSDCGTRQYPPREACSHCLSAKLPFRDVDRAGVVVVDTTIRIAGEIYFRERTPWRIGTVQLDCGPIVIAHLHGDVSQGSRIRMELLTDKAGAPAMFAMPAVNTPAMQDDRQYREFTCDPKFRRVLVTDGRTEIGQALVRALSDAGARKVFVGIANPWKPFAGKQSLARAENVECVQLDVTDTASVVECAAQIGARVDILVNTTEHIRLGGLMDQTGIGIAREALELRSLGLMRLAQSFGPIMRARGADGVDSACAFVNLLAAHALMNWPSYGASSAAEAAALSMSQCLRSELRHGGIRVVNMFVGPLETEWYQNAPPPKVSPATLARAVVQALCSGQEDCFVGEVARDLRARLAANPKALERELGAA